MNAILESKNRELLRDFTAYCANHPEERFWQALRNWSGKNFVYVSDATPDLFRYELEDTFYWEGRNK